MSVEDDINAILGAKPSADTTAPDQPPSTPPLTITAPPSFKPPSTVETDIQKVQQPGYTPPETPTGVPGYVSFGRGATDPMRGGAQLAAHLGATAPITGSGEFGGGWNLPPGADSAYVPPADVIKVQNKEEQDYQDQRKAGGQTGVDWYRAAGNLVSPANLAMPGAGPYASIGTRLAGGAVSGAAAGALAPQTGEGNYWTTVARNTGLGAGLGAGVNAAGPVLAGALSPAQQALKDAGVWLSSGKAGGALSSAAENFANVFPWSKPGVQKGVDNMLDSFNISAANQWLKKLPGGDANLVPGNVTAGPGVVNWTLDKAGEAYDSVLPHVSFTPGQVFNDGLNKVRASLAGLKPDDKAAFEDILQQNLFKPVADNGGTLPGALMKNAETDLRNEGSSFFNANPSRTDMKLGNAINQVRDLMHQQVGTDFKPFAGTLDTIDNVYAHAQIMKEAALKALGNGEVPTPMQILTTIRQSGNKTAVARGGDELQQLATAAQEHIGSSRTPGRGPASASDMLLTDVLGTFAGAGLALGGNTLANQIPENAFPGSEYLKYGLGAAATLPAARRFGQMAFGPASPGRAVASRLLPAGVAGATPGLLNPAPTPLSHYLPNAAYPQSPVSPGGLLGPQF